MKIGFIGSGNMAEAIIKGLVARHTASPQDIIVSDIDANKLSLLTQSTGTIKASSNEEVISCSDYIVLAIKPHIYRDVIHSLKETILLKKPVLISIAAGISLETVASLLDGSAIPTVRVMPNVNVAILEGMCAVCPNEHTGKEQLDFVNTIFSALGKTALIGENLFEIYTGIAGCSPAFTYMFIEGLAKAGLKNGLPKEQALMIAAQAVYGSAKMILETGQHPYVLVDKVTSPGGTTIAGVSKLEEKALISSMIQAVEATMQRDMEIQKNNSN